MRNKKQQHLIAEKKHLEKISNSFSMKTGFNGRIEKYRIQTVLDNLKGDFILDVGCADGLMAKELSSHVKHIVAIDGSRKMIRRARRLGLKNVEFKHKLFEEYIPERKFDCIILSDILEHIDDPVELLKKSVSWLKYNGRIVILCPNANSIHRRIGVLSGLLEDTHDLNESDIKVGHRRVYDISLLRKHMRRADLREVKWGGLLLKPLSNSQMNQLGDDVVDAFYELGKNMPQDLLAEIYVQCKKY